MTTPEGAALRSRYLLRSRRRRRRMGADARRFIREHFLLTRQLRDYLTLMVGIDRGAVDRLDLS